MLKISELVDNIQKYGNSIIKIHSSNPYIIYEMNFFVNEDETINAEYYLYTIDKEGEKCSRKELLKIYKELNINEALVPIVNLTLFENTKLKKYDYVDAKLSIVANKNVCRIDTKHAVREMYKYILSGINFSDKDLTNIVYQNGNQLENTINYKMQPKNLRHSIKSLILNPVLVAPLIEKHVNILIKKINTIIDLKENIELNPDIDALDNTYNEINNTVKR